MGAWNVGIFDNDVALDWLFELEASPDTSMLGEALQNVLSVGTGYLDADPASEGLAAAEIVARLRGGQESRQASTKAIDGWLEAHAGELSNELVAQAGAVVDRVMTDPSELLGLWADSEEFHRWREVLVDLRRRLGVA